MMMDLRWGMRAGHTLQPLGGALAALAAMACGAPRRPAVVRERRHSVPASHRPFIHTLLTQERDAPGIIIPGPT